MCVGGVTLTLELRWWSVQDLTTALKRVLATLEIRRGEWREFF